MLSIVLRRTDFREYDQMITFYTLEAGKVEVLARGVKKILSKNAAYLEPFCFVEAEIIPGKKEYAHLGSVNPIDIFKNIRSDFQKSLAAKYIVTLVDKTVRVGEPDKRIMALLKSWLEWIDQPVVAPADFKMILAIDVFVVKLFYLLGFDITAMHQTEILNQKLEVLLRGNWKEIEGFSGESCHKIIYQFALYHSEVKLSDWIKLAEIS